MTGSSVVCLVASLVALYPSRSLLPSATGKASPIAGAKTAALSSQHRLTRTGCGSLLLGHASSFHCVGLLPRLLAGGPASALGWPWAFRISASRACSRTRYRLRLLASSMAVISLPCLWGSSSACSHRFPWAYAQRLPSLWLLVLVARWVLAL
jgi:hypothetical protein